MTRKLDWLLIGPPCRTRCIYFMFALYACKYLAAVTTEIALNENEWIKLNYDHTGYYRVNYSPELWQRLINQLNTDHKVQINGVSEK